MTPDPTPRRFGLPWRDAARVAADVDAELDFHLAPCARGLVPRGGRPPRRARESHHGDAGMKERLPAVGARRSAARRRASNVERRTELQ